MNFLKKDALEEAIRLLSEEVHRQYILSFEPKGGEPGKYHAIRVAVKDRPELRAATRQGYWPCSEHRSPTLRHNRIEAEAR